MTALQPGHWIFIRGEAEESGFTGRMVDSIGWFGIVNSSLHAGHRPRFPASLSGIFKALLQCEHLTIIKDF